MKKRQLKKEILSKTMNLDDETLINETKELYQIKKIDRKKSRTAYGLIMFVLFIPIVVLLILFPILIPVFLLLTVICLKKTNQEFREEIAYKYHVKELKRRNYTIRVKVQGGFTELEVFKNKYWAN